MLPFLFCKSVAVEIKTFAYSLFLLVRMALASSAFFCAASNVRKDWQGQGCRFRLTSQEGKEQLRHSEDGHAQPALFCWEMAASWLVALAGLTDAPGRRVPFSYLS